MAKEAPYRWPNSAYSQHFVPSCLARLESTVYELRLQHSVDRGSGISFRRELTGWSIELESFRDCKVRPLGTSMRQRAQTNHNAKGGLAWNIEDSEGGFSKIWT